MRRRNNSQEILQNKIRTACAWSDTAEPWWYGDTGIHVQYSTSPEGFRYTGISADRAALSEVRKLVHGEHVFARDYEFVCMVNLRVVTGKTMRVCSRIWLPTKYIVPLLQNTAFLIAMVLCGSSWL